MNPEQLEQALAEVNGLLNKYDWSVALKSIQAQLQYLLSLERGELSDRSKLSSINIGVLAAREVEDMDRGIAEHLYAISAEVKRMV